MYAILEGTTSPGQSGDGINGTKEYLTHPRFTGLDPHNQI